MLFHVTAPSKLLLFLKEQFKDSSTSQIKKWIEQGRIEINQKKTVSPIAHVTPGDTISFLNRIKRETDPFTVLYEDDHLIVIDKPSGLLSVDTETPHEMSLHAYLKQRFPKKKIGVVHRLDKDTSGAILFALDEPSYHSLKEQLKVRTMKRSYLVLVEGIVEGSGTWDCHLAEDSSLIMRIVSPPQGERAITHWKALGNNKKNTLLECHLQTGKKNQIRVQAAHFGHPIVGDTKYESSRKKPRLALHAFSLEFVHPITKEKMSCTSPIPKSFLSLLSSQFAQLISRLTH